MNYYDELETFEDWDLHYDYIMNEFGYDNELQMAIDIVEDHLNIERFIYEGTYNRHPLRVARILIEEFEVKDKHTILIGLLHDLIEWSNYDEKGILHNFGGKVYTGVKALTKRNGVITRDFINGIDKFGSINIVKVKLADKLDNNRGVYFSGDKNKIQQGINDTEQYILPLAKKYYPFMINKLNDSVNKLETKT